jgi:hypothetical protein
MNKLLFIIPLILQLESFAQNDSSQYNFDYKIMEVDGDLNKDKLPDKVVVAQDTLNENAPYRLQIFFRESNGLLRLIVTSIKIIEPRYPDGRDAMQSWSYFSDVTITNGVLAITHCLVRGQYKYKFRYQNGHFELIGFFEAFSNGNGMAYTYDFNLLTGIIIDESERYDV